MSSTTGRRRNRRYIRVSQQRKTKLRWPENSIEHQNVQAAQQHQCEYVHTSKYVCIQARPISTNPRSTEEQLEYGLPSGTCFTARRLEVVAFAGLLWTYFMVCFLSVWWDFVFFFAFFTSKAHGLLQVRGNLASCTSLLVPGWVQGAIICLVCLSVCTCVCNIRPLY